MPSLAGTVTEQNLKDPLAWEGQANRRYVCLANKADVAGFNDVAAVFRATAESETGHVHDHLEYLEEAGGPATGTPIGRPSDDLKAAIAAETHEHADMYPAWLAPPARKVSTRSPTGSRRSPRPGSRMPAASKRRSGRFDPKGSIGTMRRGNTTGGKHGRRG